MNDASSVVFNEEKHTYMHNGVLLPSVTQILARLYDFSAVNDNVLAAKAELGRAVHMCCELDDANDLDEASVAPTVMPYLDAYRKFKREKCSRMVATEQIVYSAAGYAGKYDLLADMADDDGPADRWLIDWKTPLTINPAVALQTAGYVAALPRHHLPPEVGKRVRRAALQLKNNGTYKLHEFKDPTDYPTFLSFLNTHRWMQRNNL